MTADIYDFEVQTIAGDKTAIGSYEKGVMLIVNTASKCGFTPQYEGLEALYQKYKDQGLVVLGFPCNQFGAQEPGTDPEILEFAESNYQINFPLFSKIEVNGDGACELYQLLTESISDDEGKSEIAWNFTKFLVDREGSVVARFAPTVTPEEIGEKLAE